MPESDIRVLKVEVGMLKNTVSDMRDDFKQGQEKMLATMHELAVNVNKIAENDIKRDEYKAAYQAALEIEDMEEAERLFKEYETYNKMANNVIKTA